MLGGVYGKIATVYMVKQAIMALVGSLDRGEAMSVLKKVTSRCAGSLAFTVSFIDLIPPRTGDTLSKGYQIHIKSEISPEDKSQLQNIIDSHQLALKEVGDNLIIYKPKK